MRYIRAVYSQGIAQGIGSILLLALLLAQVRGAMAEQAPWTLDHYQHTAFTKKDGGPQSVLNMAQTSDGMLWTDDVKGLMQFDGHHFTPFVPRAGEALTAQQRISDVSTKHGRLGGELTFFAVTTEFRDAEGALREEEDHYRHTVALNPQVPWTSDPSGTLDHVAPRWFELTGTTGLQGSWAGAIHVDDIDLVIQADAPDEYKTYLHRAGRTGRAGKTGIAVTFVDWDDLHKWTLIDKALEFGIPEPTETYSSSPHLYEDLDIPAGTKGRLPGTHATTAPRAERTPRQSSGSGSESGSHSRSRSRTRPGGSGAATTSAPAAETAGSDTVEAPRAEGDAPRRRRRRRRGGSGQAPAAE